MSAASFTDSFLRLMYSGPAFDGIQHIAMFNRWAYWKRMAEYGTVGDCQLLPWADNANDWSPEPPDDGL